MAFRDPIASEVAKANFPQRPAGDFGQGLQTFKADANNFLVRRLPAGNMHHYDTIAYVHQPPPRPPKTRNGKVVDANEISKAKARVIVHKMQVENPAMFTGIGAYDGRKNLYLVYKLNLDDGGLKIRVDLKPLTGQTVQQKDMFIVSIKFAATVDVGALKSFVQGGAIGDPVARRAAHQNSATAVMFVNEILRRVPTHSDKWLPVGRTFLSTDKNRHTELRRNGLVLVPGFFQSVRPCLSGLNVTVDSAIGVMFPDIPLPDLIMQFLGGQRDLRMLSTSGRGRFLESRQSSELRHFLKGLKVFANRSNKAKKIMDIVNCADDYRFDTDSGERISITEHFRRTYNITLRYPEVICVQVGEGTPRPVVYPIELCTVKPGQLYKRTVPPDVTREMQRLGATKPEQRLKDIRDGFRLLDLNADTRSSGIEVSQDLLKIDGRILPRPRLWFRNQQGTEHSLQPPAMSNYTLPGMRFNKPRKLENWGVLAVFAPQDRDYREVAMDFARKLRAVLGGIGMDPGIPKIGETIVSGNVEAALNSLASDIGNPDVIVVVLPTSAAEARHRVKYWGDAVRGIATQCVKIDKIRNVKDDYLHNLAMKINVRVGGTNHVLGVDAIPWGAMTAMVVGADVSHPPAGDSSQPSVSALCASWDGPLCEYISTSRVQTRRSESIEHFKEMMQYIIEGFRHLRLRGAKNARTTEERLNAIWPSIMIIYRDGVGEGQYATVTDEETRAAHEAIEAVKAKYQETSAPKTRITYIIVSKRHHQRFFPSGRDGDRSGNCFPGSVFDKGVAHPTLFDFWLQSQAAIKGTARPAHYIVCHDENNIRVDALQRLSYCLCYVYARATRSVSIPAPVYYADLICGRSKFMFDPDTFETSSMNSSMSLEQWQRAYRQPHSAHQARMYFI